MTDLTLAKLLRANAIIWPKPTNKREIDEKWSDGWISATEKRAYLATARRLLKAWRKR